MMEDEFYENLLVALECPICMKHMTPPIRQCATGHNICVQCLKRLSRCAICQGSFSETRNFSLEALAVKMHYPCVNKAYGCTARLSYTEKDVHELRCPLKGVTCAMVNCAWKSNIDELLTHWISKSSVCKPYGNRGICRMKLKEISYFVNLVNAYDTLFWFKCKKIKQKIVWAVQYVGNSSESEDYHYEIEIFMPGKNKTKIILSDYCQSAELTDNQLFENGVTSWITIEALSNFVGDDQQVIYYFRLVDKKSTQKGNITPLQNKVKKPTNEPGKYFSRVYKGKSLENLAMIRNQDQNKK